METCMKKVTRKAVALGLFLLAGSLAPGAARAHCDGLDGPVVTAAREAFDSGEVNRILIWVRSEDEAELRAAFDRAVAVRKLGPEAQTLADTFLFETLVRLHRVSEGAPYTGLKPAGRDLGPAIPAADAALRSGSDAALVALLTSELQEGLRARFAEAARRRGFAPQDVAAGRDYVEAYVSLLNYVERVHEAIERTPGHHFPED
jgi:hypothetical protein